MDPIQAVDYTPPEGIDFLPALSKYYPHGHYDVKDRGYDNITWTHPTETKPPEEELLKLVELVENERPMEVLRNHRDKLMKKYDWVGAKSITTGEPVPDDWKVYLQALRDLPQTVTPTLDEYGQLNNVVWPTPPQ